MTVTRAILFLTAAIATGLGAGMVLADRLGDSAEGPAKAEPMPVEAPVRAAKEARLDAACERQTWPYIAPSCLERVSAVRPVVETVTVAQRAPEIATTTLTRTPVLKTASR
ncbi:hypothetical protein [Prosthecomicrobium sp. N25]|uniref:hypothetical protein n=1 Tax=Prosthecomicrobium sp. N25 TaxID=3129254 RepID=UPI0030769FB9